MLRLTPFTYYAPASVPEAIALMEGHGDEAAIMGGGTDVLPNVKHRLVSPRFVIGLRGIPEIHGITALSDGTTRVGAGATLSQLESSPHLKELYSALVEAAGLISTPQVRRLGTLGGNICLDTRCNYYNQSEHWRRAVGFCMKNGSHICRVAPGSDRCWAVSSADTAPVLLAYDAQIVLRGPEGQRTVPLSSFYQDDGLTPTGLRANEILTEVLLPPPKLSVLYTKLRIRMSFDFPLLGVATGVAFDENGRIRDARIIVTATGSCPQSITEAEDVLKGNSLTEGLIERAGEIVFHAVHPLDNTEGTIPHRKRMAQVYVERSLRQLGRS